MLFSSSTTERDVDVGSGVGIAASGRLLGAGKARREVAGDIAVEGLEAREALREAASMRGFVGRGRTRAEFILLLESVLGLEVAILRLLGGKPKP